MSRKSIAVAALILASSVSAHAVGLPDAQYWAGITNKYVYVTPDANTVAGWNRKLDQFSGAAGGCVPAIRNVRTGAVTMTPRQRIGNQARGVVGAWAADSVLSRRWATDAVKSALYSAFPSCAGRFEGIGYRY